MNVWFLSANWLSFNLSLHLTLLLLIPCVPQLVRMITNRMKEFPSDDQQYDLSAITVRQLKTILDRRGEKYQSTGLEKTDLVKLVQKLALTRDELDGSSEEQRVRTTTNDPGEVILRQFHSQLAIERNRNTVWLIQTDILRKELRGNFNENSKWSVLVADLLPAGIQLGNTNCSVMSSFSSLFCTKTDATIFVLAIPTENGPNDLYGYSKKGSVTPWKVYNWIEQTLKFSVQSIGSRSELDNQWIKFPLKHSTGIKTTEITLNRCVLFSNVDTTQLLVYVLGLQMRNRLKFGVMVVGEGTPTSIQDAGLNLTWLPAYVIFTPNGVYRYGRNIGETEDKETMQGFFRMLSPRAEDVFQFSFIIILHSILCLVFIHWMPSLCLFVGFLVFWSVGAIVSSATSVVAMLSYISHLWHLYLNHRNSVLLRFAIQWYMSFTGNAECISYFVIIASGILSGWLSKKIVFKLENRD